MEVSLVLRVSGQETNVCLGFKLDKNWFMLEMHFVRKKMIMTETSITEDTNRLLVVLYVYIILYLTTYKHVSFDCITYIDC